MTSARQGLAETVALVKRSWGTGALSAVVGLDTREELVKMPVSGVLPEFATKDVVRISVTMVSNVSVRQVTLGTHVRKVRCFSGILQHEPLYDEELPPYNERYSSPQ